MNAATAGPQRLIEATLTELAALREEVAGLGA